MTTLVRAAAIVLACCAALALVFVAAVLVVEPVAAAPGTDEAAPPSAAPAETGLRRLSPQYEVWIDPERKRVVMNGRIVLREGPLELLACLKGTKEHEAIIAVETEAFIVHAALLALGAQHGQPVQYQPEYRPASGTIVDLTVFWTGADGQRKRARAADWIRDAQTGKPLDHPWVFAGSGFYVDQETGQRFYLAEDGDFICVANFPSAMLDLPIESSQANDGLLFEAYTERIPPVGTTVTLVLTPRLDPPPAAPSDENATDTGKE